MTTERKEWLLSQRLPQKLRRAERRKLFDGEENAVLDFIKEHGSETLKDCITLNEAHRAKLCRIRKRIKPLVMSGKALFLTLTFTDEVLSKTTQKVRRKYVQRYLRSQCASYVANIDFGSENEREHYHALAIPAYGDKVDLEKWRSLYGAINCKRVHSEKADLRRISKYVAKLSYHAVKNTADGTSNVLWSQNPRCNSSDCDERAPEWLTLDNDTFDDLF